MTTSFSEIETMPSSHVNFIKYMGILSSVFGLVMTLMGCIPGSTVSTVLIYTGLALLTCGGFFWLAYRSLSRSETSKQTLPMEETFTVGTISPGHTEPADLTSLQIYLENVRKYVDLSNQTGNSLIVKVHQNGFTSFEMVTPNLLDPAIFSASSLVGLDASLRNFHHLQAELIIHLIELLRKFCSDAQFQNGRCFVYDDGTIAMHLWPKEKKDSPPKYTEVYDDVDLPSYCDVTFVDMVTVDANFAEKELFCSSV